MAPVAVREADCDMLILSAGRDISPRPAMTRHLSCLNSGIGIFVSVVCRCVNLNEKSMLFEKIL